MRTELLRILSVLACTLYLTSPCSASVCGLLDLKRDSGNAELICVGRVVFAEKTDKTMKSTFQSSDVLAEFEVDRVLKGTLEPGSSIQVSYVSGHQHFSGYDLVLLKKRGELYEFSRQEGSVPVSESVRSAYQQSDDVLSNLRWEMMNSLQDSSRLVVMSALEQSSLLLPSDIDRFVRPRIEDADYGIRGRAFGACIAAGLDTLVIPALDFVEQVETDIEMSEFNVPLTLLVAIRRFRIGPEMVDAVASKLTSQCDIVRQLASFMLRQSMYRTTLPYFKKLLDDPDFKVRYTAVMGMGSVLAGRLHGPSINKFAEEEASYLHYWKTRALD